MSMQYAGADIMHLATLRISFGMRGGGGFLKNKI